MQSYPLVVSAVCKERIWGGSELRERFGFPDAGDQTGEAWIISAHPNGPSRIVNGPYAGKTIPEVMELHPDWFDQQPLERFPLLVKLLDCRADLSVQVHPDDVYARTFGELGKTECWYIVDAAPGAEIVLGHTAQTREEFRAKAESGDFGSLLKRVPVKAGDFFFVPSGTVHALGQGLLVFETQQSSDVTYRLYDYDRRDAAGNLRELHLEESIQVTACPPVESRLTPVVVQEPGRVRTTFVNCDYFTVEKWTIQGTCTVHTGPTFTLLSVLAGEGRLLHGTESIPLQKGTSLLLPAPLGAYQLEGEFDSMVSWIPPV